jgi:hypothetical protein
MKRLEQRQMIGPCPWNAPCLVKEPPRDEKTPSTGRFGSKNWKNSGMPDDKAS